jgi:hypothetical protein
VNAKTLLEMKNKSMVKLDDEPKEMIIVWTHEYCAIDKQIRRHNVYTRMRGARFSAQLYLSS